MGEGSLMERKPISLVITDLDNTIYDWMTAFVPAFYAMVRVAAPLIGVSEDELLDDLRSVHQKHGDSEHPFALLETRAVQERMFGSTRTDLLKHLDPAFHEFNRVRKKNLHLYDGVLKTLSVISQTGVPIIAYTDARVVNCLFRLKKLGIRQLFSQLFAPSHFANELRVDEFEEGFVQLLPPTDRKPNPQTLIDICARYSVRPSEALYIGDSIVRDVYMAKTAGLQSAWAKFGATYEASLWPLLVRVTHWTNADVEREEKLREQSRGTQADTVLNCFSELLEFYEFVPRFSALARPV
ncbi:HAD family hydrolase [Tardiphaga sp. OK246]|jgi:phosphoglycolate phosphatase|uniref:HAD family hydrolase n=1 Tax=Tardiphaga sp. OK246 TaxID=1855307 RepID=UPI000B773BF3|nr:HAD family hydrolase [Tardiphaga sp. OK246]